MPALHAAWVLNKHGRIFKPPFRHSSFRGKFNHVVAGAAANFWRELTQI